MGKNKIRVFEMRIDGLISFEIEDFLNRIIDNENIILTATDVSYTPIRQNLKNENKDILIVCEKVNYSIRDYGFSWGDIAYPIAFAMGLTRSEL